VRQMCRTGAARALMGNHEFNAIAFHTERAPGVPYRPHTPKNVAQHARTLEQFSSNPAELRDMLDWFRRLPLLLDLDGLRVVHASWHTPSIEAIDRIHPKNAYIDDERVVDCIADGTEEFDATEVLLKGPEAPLPIGTSFKDKDGIDRSTVRIRWWLDDLDRPWRDLAMGPPTLLEQLPDELARIDGEYGYPEDAPPVFFGHYWLQGRPTPLRPNVACVDYSVAMPGGQLVAYRWDGEQHLSYKNFLATPRVGN
jgi:hypothetical protein